MLAIECHADPTVEEDLVLENLNCFWYIWQQLTIFCLQPSTLIKTSITFLLYKVWFHSDLSLITYLLVYYLYITYKTTEFHQFPPPQFGVQLLKLQTPADANVAELCGQLVLRLPWHI